MLNKIAITFLAAASFACQANADIIVSFVESEAGVTVTGSGSISTFAGLSSPSSGVFQLTGGNGFSGFPSSGNFITSSGAPNARQRFAIASGTGFSTYLPLGGNQNYSLDSDPGVSFGFSGNGGAVVVLPENYVEDEEINFSVFNIGRTLEDFDMVAGESGGASWETGNGGTEAIVFRAVTAVPEPASAIPALIGVFAMNIRRKRASK